MTTSSVGDLINNRVDNLLSLFKQQNTTNTNAFLNIYSIVNNLHVTATGISTFSDLISYYSATKYTGAIYTVISNTGLYDLILTYTGSSTFVTGKYSSLLQLTADVNFDYFTDGIVFINTTIYVINSGTIIPFSSAGSLTASAISKLSTTDNGILNLSWLQAAINLGGTITIPNDGTNPVYKLAGTTYLSSNTKLVIDPGVTLRAVTTPSTIPFNIFANVNVNSTAQNIISITPSQQVNANNTNGGFLDTLTIVFSTTPSCTVGNYIFLKNDSYNIYNDFYKVLTVSTNTVTVETSGLNASSYYNYTNSGITINGTFTTTGNFTVMSTSAPLQLLGKTITGLNVNGSGVTKITKFNGTVGSTHAIYGTNITATANGAASNYTIFDQITATVADVNIEITGGGIIDGNFTAGGFIDPNAASTYTNYQKYHGVLFNNVKDPYTHDIYFHDVYGKCVYISNSKNPVTKRIKAITGNGGVHYTGPCFGNVLIDEITGNFGSHVAVFETVPAYITGSPVSAGGSFYNGGTISNIKAFTTPTFALATVYLAGSMITADAYIRYFGTIKIENIDTLISQNQGYGDGALAFKLEKVASTGYGGTLSNLQLNNIVGAISITPNVTSSTSLISLVKINNHTTYSNTGSAGMLSIGNIAVTTVSCNSSIIYSDPSATIPSNLTPSIYCNLVNNYAVINELTFESPILNSLEADPICLVGGVNGAIGTLNVLNATFNPYGSIINNIASISYFNYISTINICNAKNVSGVLVTLIGYSSTVINVNNSPISGIFNFASTNNIKLFGSGLNSSESSPVLSESGNSYPGVSFAQWPNSAPATLIDLASIPSFFFNNSSYVFYGKSKTIAYNSSGYSTASATLLLPTAAIDGEVYEIDFATAVTTLSIHTYGFSPTTGTGLTTLSFTTPTYIPDGATLYNSSGSNMGVTIINTGNLLSYNLSGPVTITTDQYHSVGGTIIMNKFNSGSIPLGLNTSITWNSTINNWI